MVFCSSTSLSNHPLLSIAFMLMLMLVLMFLFMLRLRLVLMRIFLVLGFRQSCTQGNISRCTRRATRKRCSGR